MNDTPDDAVCKAAFDSASMAVMLVVSGSNLHGPTFAHTFLSAMGFQLATIADHEQIAKAFADVAGAIRNNPPHLEFKKRGH